MEFKDKLKELRRQIGVSQQQLADDLHISRSVIAKWETGLALPNDEYLELLAKYFKVKKEELIENYKNEKVIVTKTKSISNMKKIIIGLVTIIIIIAGLFTCFYMSLQPKKLSKYINKLGANYELSIYDCKTNEWHVFDKYENSELYEKIITISKSVKYETSKIESDIENDYLICLKGNINIELSKTYIKINDKISYLQGFEPVDSIDIMIDNLCDYLLNFDFILNEDKSSYTIKNVVDKSVKEIIIPSVFQSLPVTVIGESAFEGCVNLESIYICNSIKEIKDHAFSNCVSLKSLEIPKSVEFIGESILSNCTSLENLIIPFIGDVLWNTENLPFGYFFGTKEYDKNKNVVPITLKYVEISNEYNIEAKSFYYCENIETIKLGNSVNYIGDDAFRYCYALTNLIFEENTSLRSIGKGAFYNGTIEYLYFNDPFEKWIDIKFEGTYASPLQHYYNNEECPKSKFYIKNALGEYEEVTEIFIPKDVAFIGDYQFCGFDYVTNIVFEDINSIYGIGEGAFERSGIESIVIPPNVKKIDYYTFQNCKNLKKIVIPSTVKEICTSAFSTCYSLADIKFEGKLEKVGTYAFSFCKSLKEITLPEIEGGITFGLFTGCENIEKITLAHLPKKLVLFNGEIVYTKCLGTLFNADSYLENSSSVPKSLKEIVLTNETSIDDFSFYECDTLEKVYIPTSCEYIGEKAFYGCYSLTIYYEGEFIPSSWHCNWNISGCAVLFNKKLD